jgi:hypothetical protein
LVLKKGVMSWLPHLPSSRVILSGHMSHYSFPSLIKPLHHNSLGPRTYLYLDTISDNLLD